MGLTCTGIVDAGESKHEKNCAGGSDKLGFLTLQKEESIQSKNMYRLFRSARFHRIAQLVTAS
jgi:hypothetical protein